MKTLINLLPVVLLFILLLLESAFAGAPPLQWQKTFGGGNSDYGRSVQQTSDGGYIIAGMTSSYGVGVDVYLIKTDPNGKDVWQKNLGGSGNDQAYSIQQTSDCGYIIAGITGTDAWYVYLIKTDPNGNSEWQNTFGESGYDRGESVQQTTDGGYIITGVTESYGSGSYDVYLIKTEPNGNLQWQKTFGEADSDEYGSSVQQTTDGGYIIAGYTYYIATGDSYVYLIKTDPNGNSQWEKTFGGTWGDVGRSVQQTSDGGFIIAGTTWSYSTLSDVYLIKTDPNGNSEWQKTFGGSISDIGLSVQQTSDGGYVITGEIHSISAGSGDVYLIKTEPNGNDVWQKTLGGSKDDAAFSVQQTSDGGYVIAGFTDSYGAGWSDVYLIKTCPDGTLSSDFNCNGTVYYEDLEVLIDQWLQPPDILSADIYPELGDGIVNAFDFAAFANDWLQSNIP